MIFLDTETHLIEPGRCSPPIVVTTELRVPDLEAFAATFPEDGTRWTISTIMGAGYRPTLTLGPRRMIELVRLACLTDEPICGFNVAFDLLATVAAAPEHRHKVWELYDRGLVRDPMIRQQLIDIAYGVGTKRSFALDAVWKRIAKTDFPEDPEGWRLRYRELDGVPLNQWPQAAIDYATFDVPCLPFIYCRQAEYACWLADEQRQCRAAFALAIESAWGLAPNPERVARWFVGVNARYDAVEGALREANLIGETGRRNTKRAAELLAAACEEEGVTPLLTDGGGISLSVEACERVEDPLMRAYGEIGQIKSLLSKDAKILAQPIVHTRFSLAASGRSTSSAPNVQNFGKKGGVRECFLAPPGWCYVIADYAQLELCTLAQVCLDLFGRSRMAELINEGRDLHVALAAEIDEEQRGYDAINAARKADQEWALDLRQCSKAGNFGLPGGLSAGAFKAYAKASYGVNISRERAIEIRSAWFSLFSEMSLFFAHVRGIAEGAGRVHDTRADRYRGGVGFCDAANTHFQGLAANLAKHANYVVTREASIGVLKGLKPCNFVHDEIDSLAPIEIAHDLAIKKRDLMIEVGRVWCPDVKINVEIALHDALSKDAKQRFGPDGRLVIGKSE